MDIKQALKDEAGLRERIQGIMDELRASVAADISANPMNGVQPVSGGIRAAVVSFSTIQKQGNLSAETYIPAAQASAVEEKLAKCQSMQAMVDAIKNMVSSRKIPYPSGKTVYLNEKTVEILQKAIAE